MLKTLFVFIMAIFSSLSFAEAPCDIRVGSSLGVKVIEFYHKDETFSKMTLNEGHAIAILDELISLQDMGLCEEKIKSQKCILKIENIGQVNYVNMYRGNQKWNTWQLSSKDTATRYVRSLKKAGLCS